MKTLEQHYRECRASGATAVHALAIARHLFDRERTIEGTIGRKLLYEELIRVRIEPDHNCYIDDQLGDMFDPGVNPYTSPRKLEAEREEYIRKAEQFGFCGLIAEIREHDEAEWEEIDSCWGLEGWDDEWIKYNEADFLACAIEAWMESGWELEE